MTPKVLVLRPQPGADATAGRLRAMGLEAIVAPIFVIEPLNWELPDPATFNAILFTSANAVRNAGPQLEALAGLRCYAVGESTASVARQAGFRDIRTGLADGAAIISKMAAEGVRSALHLCGRDHLPLEHEDIRIERRLVYAALAVEDLPAVIRNLPGEEAVALIHSPRAAARFGALLDGGGLSRARFRLAAISPAAADAARPGWRSRHVAAAPREEALLELAAKLCQSGADDRGGAGA